MRNTSEILGIIEHEFVTWIGLYNMSHNPAFFCRIDELMILCERIGIPFECQWNEDSYDIFSGIENIRIAGKLIEFA